MPAGLTEQQTDLGSSQSHKIDTDKALEKIFLVGSPNVGKSSIFNALTNSYVTVSNASGAPQREQWFGTNGLVARWERRIPWRCRD